MSRLHFRALGDERIVNEGYLGGGTALPHYLFPGVYFALFGQCVTGITTAVCKSFSSSASASIVCYTTLLVYPAYQNIITISLDQKVPLFFLLEKRKRLP